jgi:hypothetical protein
MHRIQLVLANILEPPDGLVPCHHETFKILTMQRLHVLSLAVMLLVQRLLNPALGLDADVRYLPEHLPRSGIVLTRSVIDSGLI